MWLLSLLSPYFYFVSISLLHSFSPVAYQFSCYVYFSEHTERWDPTYFTHLKQTQFHKRITFAFSISVCHANLNSCVLISYFVGIRVYWTHIIFLKTKQNKNFSFIFLMLQMPNFAISRGTSFIFLRRKAYCFFFL